MPPLALRGLLPLVLLVAVPLGGAAAPHNPSFAVTPQAARKQLRAMQKNPVPFARPVLVFGGYRDPGFGAPSVARALRRVTEDTPVVAVSFPPAPTFDACRRKALRAARRRLSEDRALPPVDVVGISMGGLVGRHAARPREEGDCLSIRRLFTIGTPHRGARLAKLPAMDPKHRAMRSGSDFLRALDEALADAEYELICYARLGDRIVGAENTAPPGRHPYWVPTPEGESSHMAMHQDPRILADIARRLRGEKPLTADTPTPLPEKEKGS